MLAFLNMWEAVALIAVILIIFGAKKLPELARGLGSGIKEFKKASQDDEEPPVGGGDEPGKLKEK